MFAAVVLLYHLSIAAVWADAAYFNYTFLGFVHNVLHVSAARLFDQPLARFDERIRGREKRPRRAS
jgi:hypothetical protein